jgi:hypothetical protein
MRLPIESMWRKEDESQKQMNHLQTFLLRLTYEKKWTAIGLNKTIQNIKLKGEKTEISYNDYTIYTHLYNN